MDPKLFNLFIVLTSALITQKGKVLLLRRSGKNKTFQGLWQLPEGKVEKGEQPKQSLSREIKEELGCNGTIDKLLTVSSCDFEIKSYQFNILRITFRVTIKSDITLSPDHDQIGWFTLKQAVKLPNLVPGLKDLLIEIAQ